MCMVLCATCSGNSMDSYPSLALSDRGFVRAGSTFFLLRSGCVCGWIWMRSKNVTIVRVLVPVFDAANGIVVLANGLHASEGLRLRWPQPFFIRILEFRPLSS